jgi:hypothetical protein
VSKKTEPPKKPCADCGDTGKKDILHRGTLETHHITCPCKSELPIRFVFQPEKSGCGVAALAMVSGKTYLEARQYFTLERDFSETGMYDSELQEALVANGFAIQYFRRFESRLGGSERSPWPMAPVSNMAICQVKNLRDSHWHYVVLLRDGRVLDPTFGVIQGLHRFPEVSNVVAIYRVPAKVA